MRAIRLLGHPGNPARLADAVRFVEEVVAVAERLLCVLIDRNGDRLDMLEAMRAAN